MMNDNTLETLACMLSVECKISDQYALLVAKDMMLCASAHLALTIVDVSHVLTTKQSNQIKTLESWFSLIVESLPGIDAVTFNEGDIRSSTVLLKISSGSSNSFSGKWRIPVKMPSNPGTALMKTVKNNISTLEREKARKEEAAKYPASSATPMSPVDVTNKLYDAWMGQVKTANVLGKSYMLTATANGIELYTRPSKVMDRSDTISPYQEVDGVNWVFLDESGKCVCGFNGRPNGSALQGTFKDLTKFVPDLSIADWAFESKAA